MPSPAGTQGRNQNGHPNLMFEMKLVEKYFYRVGGKTVGICVLSAGLCLSPFIMRLGKPTRLTSQSKTSETGSPLNLEPQRQQ